LKKTNRTLRNIDRSLLIATIILVILVIVFDNFLDSVRSTVKRDKIAKSQIEVTFPDSEIAYLWSYYEEDGSKLLITEYLVSTDVGEIQRIKCVWEGNYPRIVMPE